MSDDNNSTNRLKLTLKLKMPATASTAAASDTKTLQVKEKGGAKSSSIQVTIKGRKKESRPEENYAGLNKSEFEARRNAVSESKNLKDNEPRNSEILAKISSEKLKLQKAAAEKQAEISDKKEHKKEHKQEVKSETQEVVKVVERSAGTFVKPTTTTFDPFDVRNKIKQSIAVTNREQEERKRFVEERKKQEQSKEAVKAADLSEKGKALDKKKLKKAPSKFSSATDSEENAKKNKPNFKDQRFSTRKLTYVIDEDSEGSFGRKRRKNKFSDSQNDRDSKDYKKISRDVALPDLITVSDLADRMSEKAGDVVKKLFSMGMVATSNQVIDADTAEIIVGEFGHKAKRVSHSDVENVLDEDNSGEELLPRAPVVTIMGHVDHGKTSLLDALRKTDVVSGEHGGITQHIGASRIQTKDGRYITFLDTPGHEAFTEMRSRGANITDIVVLVVAADDGVKEQTIEAISHAKAANVPIIVAVNKIDKPGADASRVKNELLSHEIVSEDLGGDVMFIEVSAKKNLNLDKLEEAILVQAEILELKSSYNAKASGAVLESRVDASKGVIASLLVQKGTLQVGDLIVVGTSYGKVRKMTDDKNKNIKLATPSMPIEVLGLDNVPNAGDKFMKVEEERQAREIISYRSRKEKEVKAMKNSAKSLTDIFRDSGTGKLKYLNIVIKADMHGSAEAINGSIVKLSNDEVAVKVIHIATGGITETDINLAAVSNAVIIGFNVRANQSAKEMARLKNVDIRYYSIIYNLVDDMKLLLSGMLEPVKSEEYLGQAEIRQVFKVSGAGKIAGSFVTDGMIKRNARVRLLRDNVVIHDGILKTLKRFKEDVKEVKSGFECGVSFENYEDIKEKDVVECYEIIEQKRSL